MDFDQVAKQMSTEVYQQLKSAVEIGRWADGRTMSAQQKQISLQAILQYEIAHLSLELRTGYIPPRTIGDRHTDTEQTLDSDTQTLRWQD